jgi:porin
VSVPFTGTKYKSAQQQAGLPVADAEVAFELTHYVQVRPWFGVQWGAQYFVHPGTDPTVDDALLLNMRCMVEF